MLSVEFGGGLELMDALGLYVKQHEIDYATMTLLGGVDWFRLSVMTQDDPRTDIPYTFKLPGELVGNGVVRNGAVHVHAVLGVDHKGKHRTIAGHLEAALIKTHFVVVAITPLERAPQSIRMVFPE